MFFIVASALASALAAAPPPFADLAADAGGPYEVTAGEELLLDGSGSVTFQCERAEFGWDLDGDRIVDIDAGAEPTWLLDTTSLDGPLSLDVTLFMECWLTGKVKSTRRTSSTTLEVHNADPVITSLVWDPQEVNEGGGLRMEVEFSDAETSDSQTVTWELDDGRVFDGDEAVATMVQDGTVEVVVTVADDDGGTDTDTFWVDVKNLPPELVGSPATRATVGQQWQFTPTVSDPGAEDEHRFSADLPPGASVDDTTGALTWVPTADQVGTWDFLLVVRDEDAAEDLLSFEVAVQSLADDPGSERPDSDSGAQGDPYAGQYDVAAEGCDCGGEDPAGTAAAGLLLLPLVGLRRRRR